MLKFISAKESAEKWNVSEKKVEKLCAENKIPGAIAVGNMWKIPSTAQAPTELFSVLDDIKKDFAPPKPFVKWVGGKTQLLPELERFITLGSGRTPKRYVEPMVGGGALFFNVLAKYTFEEFYILDINPELMNAYSVIKIDVDALIEMLTGMQLSFLPMDENGRKYFY